MNKIMAVMLSSTFGLLVSSGCARDLRLQEVNQHQAATIDALNREITELNRELNRFSMQSGDLAKAQQDLEGLFKSEILSGELQIVSKARGLVVLLPDSTLFLPGKVALRARAQSILLRFADGLRTYLPQHPIFIEGHTDSDPIRYSRWTSNWELSVERASEVLHFLVNQAKMDPSRMALTGYGEYRPVADNGTVEGKSKNRRIEILIV